MKNYKKCAIDNCTGNVNSVGLCSGHYYRLRHKGDPMANVPLAPHRKRKKCQVEGCETLNVSTKLTGTKYCGKHYSRLARGKDITEVTDRDKNPAIIEGHIAKIPLGTNGKDGFAIVDAEYSWLDKYKWRKDNHGYPVSNSFGTRGRNNKMHHSIVGREQGKVVDHINRDKLDNTRANLRHTTYRLNTINRGMQSNNTSGYTGVRKDTRKGLNGHWVAYIRNNGKLISKYGFKDKEKAYEWYLARKKELHAE